MDVIGVGLSGHCPSPRSMVPFNPSVGAAGSLEVRHCIASELAPHMTKARTVEVARRQVVAQFDLGWASTAGALTSVTARARRPYPRRNAHFR